MHIYSLIKIIDDLYSKRTICLKNKVGVCSLYYQMGSTEEYEEKKKKIFQI